MEIGNELHNVAEGGREGGRLPQQKKAHWLTTWLILESLLKEVGWPRRPFGGHVRRLYGMRLGAVRHLANSPPETVFPMLSRRNGGFLRPEPLRRVRVEHATVWARPIGAPHSWRDMRDAFLTRGYDELLPRFEQDPPACAFQGWRQMTRRQLTEELFAEITTTTLRLLWCGFHIELLEQTVAFFEASESEDGSSSDSTSRSRSSLAIWSFEIQKVQGKFCL